MDRRRFLKYIGTIAAVAGVSVVGIDCLLQGHVPKSSLPPTPTHLLAKVADFERTWRLVHLNQQVASMFQRVKNNADSILGKSPYGYQFYGEGQLLQTSRGIVERIYNLALIYRLTGDQRYVARAWQELESAAKFPDWNPEQFLSTAEITHAFAIGYDWLELADGQKRVLQEAIVEKGLEPALDCYLGRSKYGWWVDTESNWNQVCNGGIGMGALALLQDKPDLSRQVLNYALKSIRVGMNGFAPDGGWLEGPGYWNYATLYNCIFLAALETALGGDSGLSQIPSFSDTGLFPIYLTGPTGNTYNFADIGSSLSLSSPQMYWLARRFRRLVYAWFARSNGDLACPIECEDDYVCPGPCVGIPLGLLWFEPDLRDPTSEMLPVDRYFRVVEAVTLREAWNDRDALFVGFKAGDNNANHAHLDVGSFVLDALGQRWAIDLGADSYNLPEYFGRKRWTYYRLRAEGHNTLVLNPSEKPDQDPTAKAKITRFQSEPERSFAIAELTPAYGQRLQRGIALLGRKSIVVQDEFIPLQHTELWWFMHTPAKISLSDDRRAAVLEQASVRLWCGIASPTETRFTVMDARPLPSSPDPSGQDPNHGIRKLAIHVDVPPSAPFTLSIAMTPLSASQEPPTAISAVTSLESW